MSFLPFVSKDRKFDYLQFVEWQKNEEPTEKATTPRQIG